MKNLCIKTDKVLIKYNPNQEYEYWVYENKLEPVDKPETLQSERCSKTGIA